MKKRDCPNLQHLLEATPSSLVDKSSICAKLSQDLYKLRYTPEEDDTSSSSSSSADEVVFQPPPKKKQQTKTPSPVKTLKQLQEMSPDSDVEDDVARGGILDEETGQHLYIIEKILKYEPKHGYFVHWQGYPKSERSWQLPQDMPDGLKGEMKKARDRYKEDKERSIL
jgi:hypothetical protein